MRMRAKTAFINGEYESSEFLIEDAAEVVSPLVKVLVTQKTHLKQTNRAVV